MTTTTVSQNNLELSSNSNVTLKLLDFGYHHLEICSCMICVDTSITLRRAQLILHKLISICTDARSYVHCIS